MGRTPLIDDDVAAGRLAIAVDRPVPVTSGYWLVKPPGIETRCEIVAFRNWLLKEMSQLNWNRYSDPAAKVASLRHRGVRQAVFQTVPVWSLPRSAVAPPLKPHKLAARRLMGGFDGQGRGRYAMDLAMKDKKAIVTGASEGIGKAIAQSLAREGVDVAICARRKEPLEKTAAEIAKQTGRAIFPIVADLTKPAEAERFIASAYAALGRIDILVNNAGSAPGGVLELLTEEDWTQALQLKFMGYVRCMKHVLPII
jgi:short chain dehydrogenase